MGAHFIAQDESKFQKYLQRFGLGVIDGDATLLGGRRSLVLPSIFEVFGRGEEVNLSVPPPP